MIKNLREFLEEVVHAALVWARPAPSDPKPKRPCSLGCPCQNEAS